ncbi:BAG family molecular chaperone regulator 4 isoform 2-T2 [Pelodytes ibericus]
MSAAHRHGDGGSGYYGDGNGDVLARQRQEEEAAAASWRPGYYQQEAGASWTGGGAGGGASGAQNSPYPNYDPNCWSCSGHPRSPYPSNYPVEAQRMEHYTNGSYGTPYPPASMNPQYPGHPQNPYFSPPSQPVYPVDPYKQSGGNPQAPPHWGYQQHGGQNVSPQAQAYQQYPAHQQTMPQQSPQDEGWGAYGASNHYQWPTAPHSNPPGGHYVSGGRTWKPADVHPAAYDSQDASQTPNYSRQRPYQGYHENAQPNPAAEPKPNPPNPHYSASPQMYNRKEPANQESVPRANEGKPSNVPTRAHPSILKINQVLEKIGDMETEVDEFVGKKTDMNYRCLEELLTKELLELDSVETCGQDNIRQARKEAVRKLQSILESLERKGL